MDKKLEEILLFPTFAYAVEAPEYINSVRNFSLELLKETKINNDLYPFRMTSPMQDDNRIFDFCKYTAITAGNIIATQGYNTTGLGAYFESMWCQEHYKTSSMEYHTHPNVLMVGFYFFDVPKNSSVLAFHDPRAGKVACPLEEADKNQLTYASNAYYIQPEPGLLVFANSWLPHSFTRHGSDDPIRFLHFNVSLTEHVEKPTVEVI